MSKLNKILDELVETYHNPDQQNPEPYRQAEARADILKLIEQGLIWGGKGGEPYPNDAEFIRGEQLERLKEL